MFNPSHDDMAAMAQEAAVRQARVRDEARAGLLAAFAGEDKRRARYGEDKELARADRAARNWHPDDQYEHALSLRDSGDPRWHQLGSRMQMRAAWYEQQRADANRTTGGA